MISLTVHIKQLKGGADVLDQVDFVKENLRNYVSFEDGCIVFNIPVKVLNSPKLLEDYEAALESELNELETGDDPEKLSLYPTAQFYTETIQNLIARVDTAEDNINALTGQASQSQGSTVSATAASATGTEIGTITIDGTNVVFKVDLTSYAPKESPVLTGNPTAVTQAASNDSTSIATTAFVAAAIRNIKGTVANNLDTFQKLAAAINNDPDYYSTVDTALNNKVNKGDISIIGSLTTATGAVQIGSIIYNGNTYNFKVDLSAYAPLESPSFKGTPTAPTASTGTKTTQIATTEFVDNTVTALKGAVTNDYSTLANIETAIKANAESISSINTSLNSKQDASDTLTQISTLASAANKMIYSSARNTYATTDLTSFARQSLLSAADQATARTRLDVPSRSGNGASGSWNITVTAATNATNDSDGNQISTTYLKKTDNLNIDLSDYVQKESGKGLSTNDYTTNEKNKLASIAAGATKDTIMTGATSTAAGTSGLVPVPVAGKQDSFLKGDGTWATPPDTNTMYSAGKGIALNGTTFSIKSATTSELGGISLGGGTTNFLRADGSWTAPTNTTYSVFASGTCTINGTLVPSVAANTTTKYLRSDGTWQVPTNNTYSAGTGISISGNTFGLKKASTSELGGITLGTSGFLRYDGTWATPTNTTYPVATSSANGLMSSTDKAKLDGISAPLQYKGSVNNFTDLPTTGLAIGYVYNIVNAGGTDVKGTAIKAGDNVAYNGTGWDVLSGTVDLSGYVTKDGNKVLSTNDFTDAYKTKLEGIASGANAYTLPNASTNTKGGVIVGAGIAVNNGTISLAAASTGTIGGVKLGGGTTNFLRADGTWATPSSNDTPYSNMTGATSSAAGTAGLVPAPAAGKQTSFLRGDGTWVTPTDTDTHWTTKAIIGNSTGTVNAATTNGNTYLRIFDNNTARATLKISGTGAASVTSDSLGAITINSTDTNNATAQNISTANNTYPVLLGATANATTNIGNQAALFSSKVMVNPSLGTVTANGLISKTTQSTFVAAAKVGNAAISKDVTSSGTFNSIWNAPTKNYRVACAVSPNQTDIIVWYSLSNANVEGNVNTTTKKMSWNAETGNLSTDSFTGNLTGNVTGTVTGKLIKTSTANGWIHGIKPNGSAAVAYDNSTDTFYSIWNAPTQNYRVACAVNSDGYKDNICWYALPNASVEAGTNSYTKLMRWNAATGELTANSFSGNVTGNVTGNADTATKLLNARSLTVSLANTSTTSTFDGSAAQNNIKVAGTLGIGNGGTGLTASPSMLTNLGSTTAANVLQASPRPGITGTLSVAHGGTGQTDLSAVTVGNATSATKLQTARSLMVSLANTNTTSNFDGSADQNNIKVAGILSVANGGTGQSVLSAVTVGNATSATKDSAGNQINTTYVKNISISGSDIVFTKGNNTNTTLGGAAVSTTDRNIINGLSSQTFQPEVNSQIASDKVAYTFNRGEFPNWSSFTTLKSGLYAATSSVASGVDTGNPWICAINIRHTTQYGMLLYSPMTTNNTENRHLYLRMQQGGVWQEKAIIDNYNISTYESNNAVNQNISTNNNTYPILLCSTANATANVSKAAALFSSKVKVNPSSGQITATSFSGSLTGNADTATKLKTARKIEIQGLVAGEITFDGSANVTISTNNPVNYTSFSYAATTNAASNQYASFDDIAIPGYYYTYTYGNYGSNPTFNQSTYLKVIRTKNTIRQISWGYQNLDQFKLRSYNGDLGTWSEWRTYTGTTSSSPYPISIGGTGLTASPSMLTNLGSTSAANVLQASPRPGITGTLGIGNGGTGLTASPSMLTNLGSTSAANVLQASPRPGITGTLSVAHGGTGQTVLSAVTVGNATYASSANTATSVTNATTAYCTITTAAATTVKSASISNFDIRRGSMLMFSASTSGTSSDTTTIHLSIAGGNATVSAPIYTAQGVTMTNAKFLKGYYMVTWNGSNWLCTAHP